MPRYKVLIIVGVGIAIFGLSISSMLLIAFGVGMALSNALFHDDKKKQPTKVKQKSGKAVR